jgi:hypothetical protein
MIGEAFESARDDAVGYWSWKKRSFGVFLVDILDDVA